MEETSSSMDGQELRQKPRAISMPWNGKEHLGTRTRGRKTLCIWVPDHAW